MGRKHLQAPVSLVRHQCVFLISASPPTHSPDVVQRPSSPLAPLLLFLPPRCVSAGIWSSSRLGALHVSPTKTSGGRCSLTSLCVLVSRLSLWSCVSPPLPTRVELVLTDTSDYIVQGHRFDILEYVGCLPATYYSIPAIFIIWFPPLLLSVLTAIYASKF